jgi:hypothetical protein
MLCCVSSATYSPAQIFFLTEGARRVPNLTNPSASPANAARAASSTLGRLTLSCSWSCVQGAGVAWVCGASVEVVGWGAEETLLAEGMVARNPLTRAATCSLRVASSAAVSSLRGLGAGEARLAQGYGEVTQAGTLGA